MSNENLIQPGTSNATGTTDATSVSNNPKTIKIIMCAALLFLLPSCTVQFITREYFVTIEAAENSTVYFDPEILADIKKKSEAESTQKTDIPIDVKPGGF